jgi:hypothetical protein
MLSPVVQNELLRRGLIFPSMVPLVTLKDTTDPWEDIQCKVVEKVKKSNRKAEGRRGARLRLVFILDLFFFFFSFSESTLAAPRLACWRTMVRVIDTKICVCMKGRSEEE